MSTPASQSGPVLVLRGLSGYLRDQTFRIGHGESVTIGRSRSCTISLQRSEAFAGAAEAGPSFHKTSRRHLRIAFPHPDLVEIENISRNGTFVNGRKIDKLIVSDLRERPYEIVFGESERLVLSMEMEAAADPQSRGKNGASTP